MTWHVRRDRGTLPLVGQGRLAALVAVVAMMAFFGNIASASAAEEPTIGGHVKSAATESALAGIEVCADRQYELNEYYEYFEEGYVSERCETSKTDGSYSISGLSPGSYTVEFQTPFESSLNYRRQFYNAKPTRSEASPVALAGGATVSNINASMQAGGRIQGTVSDATNKKHIAGIRVCATERTGEERTQCAQSASTGEYTIPGLAAGEYIVEFGLPPESTLNYLRQYYSGKINYSEGQPVSVAAAGTTTGINASLSAGGSISGTVTDAASKAAIAGIEVCANESAGEGGYYERCVSTASNGTYTLGGLSSAQYGVVFSAPTTGTLNYLRRETTGVAVTVGSVTSGINAALEKGAAISGKVTGAATNAAVQGIQACAYSEDVGWGECATTNAAGEYTIRRLATSSYAVEFSVPYGTRLNYVTQYYNGVTEYEHATLVSATQGAETTGINDALAEGGVITGTVTNAATKAAIRAVLVCAFPTAGGENRCESTNANGEYRLGRLSSGSYRVEFAPYDYYYGTNTRYVAQYYNGKSVSEAANLVAVSTGGTTTGVNAALTEAGKISGTVTNSTTKAALAGASVCAERVSGEYLYQCATTASNGEYTVYGLPTGEYRVSFSGSEYITQYYNGKTEYEEANPVAATNGKATTGINAALVEAGRIAGTVTSAATKAGVSGVDVCVYDVTGEYVDRCVATGSSGEYTVAGLPTGEYRVSFSGYEYAPQYYNGKTSLGEATKVAVTDGKTTTAINATLSAAAKISGTVTSSATKAAVSNASVCAFNLSGEYVACAASNSTGEYTLGGLGTGEYHIEFSELGYVTQYYNAKAALTEANPVAATSGKTTTGINAALVEAAKITGTVTNAATKAPVSGVYVCASRLSGESVGCADTGSNGEYTIPNLSTGEYHVSFTASGYVTQYYNGKRSSTEATPVTATTGQTTTGINAALVEAGKVTGTVTDATTKAPIEHASVCASSVSGEYSYECATTNAAGEYTITGLSTAEYKIGFTAASALYKINYAPQYYHGKASYSEAEPIAVAVGGIKTGINAAMQPGGKISGQITAAATKAPLQNAEACASGTSSSCAIANSNGEYTILGLAAGSYSVSFTGPSGQNFAPQYYNGKSSYSEATLVPVSAGGEASGINAALRPGGTIKGTVTNANKEPVEDTEVCAISSTGIYSPCVYTNTSGEYTVTGLAAGQYRVEFYGNGSTYATQYYNGRSTYNEAELVTVTAGGTTTGINALMGLTGTVTGTVTSAATKAGLEGIEVCARRRNGEYGTGCTTTGTGGKYTVTTLNPGEYVVEFAPTTGANSNYATQFYNGKSTFNEATGVHVSSGGTVAEVNAALTEGGELSGKVTDATTKAAVSGASVCALEKLGEVTTRCATTNTSGEYTITSLSPGQYRVRFTSGSGEYATQYYEGASSYSSAQVVAAADGVDVEGINAALSGGGKIAGVVTAAASKAPIAGISVCAGESCATTNSSGEYTLIGLGAGEYTVAFRGNGLNYIATQSAHVTVTPHTTTGPIDASMSEGGQIAGVVTDSSTKGALSGVLVCAGPQGGSSTECARTNVNGEYTIAGLPGASYVVSFAATEQDYLLQYYNGKSSSGEANTVGVTVGGTASSINAALVRGGEVAGTVTAATTKASLGHVQVCATQRGGGGSGCTTTNPAGEYEIAGLPAGEYTVSFNGTAAGYLTQYYNGKSSAGEATAVTIAAGATTTAINGALEEGGKISGKVTDATTKAAIQGIEIYVFDTTGTQVVSAVTKPNGEYIAEGLPTGQYRLEFVSTSGAYEDQYYNAQTTLGSATPVSTSAGGHVTTGINAALSLAGSASSPAIAAISPNRGREAGGTAVTITGADLGSASAVSFGGSPATSFAVESANRIRATAPAGAHATVDVRVTTPQGTTPIGLADRYLYQTSEEVEREEAEREAAEGKPTVTEVTPHAVLQSGGTVTLTGANYEHVEAVTFGGEPAASVEVNSSTKITAVVPLLKTRTCSAQVKTSAGTSVVRTANELECVPEGAAPLVSGLSPKKGPDSGGTSVTVTGSNLAGVTQVVVGGYRATQVHVVSETSLTMVVPAHAEGTAEVVITTANGTSKATSKDKYKYTKPPLPTVGYVSPDSGPKAGGTKVTVGGTNFVSGMSFVFGKVSATATECIATSCTVIAPAATATGSVDIVAVNGKSKSKKTVADKYAYE